MRLYGKNPVLERIKTNPRSIRKIYIQEGHQEAGYIRKKAKKWGIPVYTVPRTKVQKLARNVNTQGLVVETDDFPYVPYEDLLETAWREKVTPVFLDGLNDPQNLGGILRGFACLGGFALVLPTHKSVDVTETVLRVACGGENYVSVAKVSNLAQAISAARELGFWIVGAVVGAGENIMEASLTFPLALVIGSEQKGIRGTIEKLLDKEITIPMAQPRLSLNAAHAATLLGYEIKRQQRYQRSTSQ